MSKITLIAYCLVACVMSIVVLNNIDPWRPTEQEQQLVYTPWEPIPPLEPAITVEKALKSIKKDDLKKMVYFLSSSELQGRLAGSPGCRAAAKYIEANLKNSGLKTMRDPFQWSSTTTENVYGWIQGKEFPNEVVVVGAHYDHIGRGSPGADDNASGTATVLELAKTFAMFKDLKRTIVFQLYSAEETGLWGSNYYCRNPKFPIGSPSLDKHVFMMNLDMVGYLHRKTSFHRAEGNSSPNALINSLLPKYPFVKDISFRGGGGSDHANFNRYGRGRIDVIWLFTGTHENYHRLTDTPDKLNYEGMEQITKYAFEMLYLVVQKNKLSNDFVKTTNFIIEPEIYDHGDPRTPFLK